MDLEPACVRIASEKRPDGNFQAADMQRFELGSKFDILICLFSAIGYLLTADAIRSTLDCFKTHLAEGGGLFIQPFIEPDAWSPGRSNIIVAEDNHGKVFRIMTRGGGGGAANLLVHHLLPPSPHLTHVV